MRILVTGGAGMVGSHAAEYWAAQGHEVTILDNLMRSHLFGSTKESVEHNWHYLGTTPQVRRVKGDIRNPDDLRQAMSDGVDVVLHAAAQPGVGFSLQRPEEDFTINAFGTLQVLEAVRQYAPKAVVLYCSTNKVYGMNVDRLPLTEQQSRYAFQDGYLGVSETMSIDLTGHTPYGVSKLAGELYVQDYAHTYGLRTGVFRMSCIFGTRQFGCEDQGWVAHLTISTILGRPVTIYGDGKQVHDVLYVEDLIAAFDRFIRSSLTHGVFNVGGGLEHALSLQELLTLLERLTGKRSPVTYRGWRPSDQKVYISDIRQIREALGWQPHIPVMEGLERVIAWVKQNQNLF